MENPLQIVHKGSFIPSGTRFTLFQILSCRSHLFLHPGFLFQQWKPQKDESGADKSNVWGPWEGKRMRFRSEASSGGSPNDEGRLETFCIYFQRTSRTRMDETVKKGWRVVFVTTRTLREYGSLMFRRYCDLATFQGEIPLREKRDGMTRQQQRGRFMCSFYTSDGVYDNVSRW